MKQAYRKTAFAVFLMVLWPMPPALAWDDCLDFAREAPAMIRAEGRCEMIGTGKKGRDGKVIRGRAQCRDATGKILGESRFRKGHKTSTWFFDAGGRKLSFGLNADQKLHGSAGALDQNGSPLCELNFENGKLDGPVREYYPGGKIRRSYSVINDRREGKFVEYDRDGRPTLERFYESDVETVEKFYYPGGQLREHSVRHPERKSYTTKNYWPDGKLQREASFEIKTRSGCLTSEAVRVGKSRQYAADGSLQEEANFDENGKPDGAQIRIDEKGRRTESVFRNGKLTARKVFAANGEPEFAEDYPPDGSRKE